MIIVKVFLKKEKKGRILLRSVNILWSSNGNSMEPVREMKKQLVQKYILMLIKKLVSKKDDTQINEEMVLGQLINYWEQN